MKPILAMWSGPRNLSTAMMRAWDEPFYAAYLDKTDLDHPMRDEIMAADETDASVVIQRCSTPNEGGFFYQKHMTHHMLPEFSLDWLADIHHCFLLRDPREVLLSYSQKREQVTLEDIGVPQQLALYRQIREVQSSAPLVVDARDFLQQPREYLNAMCKYVGIPFDESMLSWPAGRRASDGVWSEHWYDSVWKSTGFKEWQPREGELSPELAEIYQQANKVYQHFLVKRLVL